MTREAVLSWVQAQQSRLHASSWAPQLTVDGVEVLDAVIAYLVYALHERARQRGREAAMPREILFRRVRRRWQAVRHEVSAHRHANKEGEEISIVFWPREPTHILPQVEVARVLKKRGIPYRFLACQAKVFAALREEGEMPQYTKRLDRAAQRRAARRGRAAAAWVQNHDPGVILPPLGPISSQDVLVIYRAVLTRTLPTLYQTLAALQAAQAAYRPSVLVVGNDLSLEGRTAALALAHASATSTAALMHGSIKQSNELHRLHLVDQYMVYSEATRAVLLDFGLSSEQVVVTGAPYLDVQLRQPRGIDKRIRRNLGLREGAPWVLVATSGPGDSVSAAHHQALVRTLAEASARLPDVTFLVKLHRKDRVRFYEEHLAAVPGSRLHVVPHGSSGWPEGIFSWFQGCPLLITGGSTVALEAMLLGVPVLTIDFAGEMETVNFIRAGATRHVTHPSALESAIRAGLAEGFGEATRHAADAYATSFYGVRDGKAAERVAETLSRMLDKPACESTHG